jgi:hypothetical protein
MGIDYEAERRVKHRNPPTQDLGVSIDNYIDYDEDTHVKWVCPCGGDLEVWYVAHNYQTYAKCKDCGLTDDIHTG